MLKAVREESLEPFSGVDGSRLGRRAAVASVIEKDGGIWMKEEGKAHKCKGQFAAAVHGHAMSLGRAIGGRGGVINPIITLTHMNTRNSDDVKPRGSYSEYSWEQDEFNR